MSRARCNELNELRVRVTRRSNASLEQCAALTLTLSVQDKKDVTIDPILD